MKPKYEQEYLWAIAHPDDPQATTLLQVAALYARHRDAPTLGLVEAAALAVRKKMT